MDNETKNIKKEVDSAIESGRVRMRPRWHFILRTALYASGTVLVMLSLLYFCSFIIFIQRQTGVWFAPSFGLRGWYAFFIYSPWLIVISAIFSLFILEILAGHFSLAYRQPVIYSALVFIILAAVGGYLIAMTPFHDYLYESASKGELPVAGGIYRQYERQKYSNLHRGEIIELNDNGFIMEDRRDESVKVIVSPQTSLISGDDFFVGQDVVVFGPVIDGSIRAAGINKLVK